MKDFFGNEKKSYNLSLLLIIFAHRVQSSLTYQIKSNVIQNKNQNKIGVFYFDIGF